jgi:hypothetical protein
MRASIEPWVSRMGRVRSPHTDYELICLDRLLTTLFNNNTKKLLDDLSNESSTNSSGFHSKSTTTLFNNEYSPKINESNDFTYSGKIIILKIYINIFI